MLILQPARVPALPGPRWTEPAIPDPVATGGPSILGPGDTDGPVILAPKDVRDRGQT